MDLIFTKISLQLSARTIFIENLSINFCGHHYLSIFALVNSNHEKKHPYLPVVFAGFGHGLTDSCPTNDRLAAE